MMALSVEGMQELAVIASTMVPGQGGEAFGSSTSLKDLLLACTENVEQGWQMVSSVVIEGFTQVTVILKLKVFGPAKELFLRAGGVNGIQATESGQMASPDLEAGGGFPSRNSREGFFDDAQGNQDIIMEMMVPEDDGSALLQAAEHAKNPRAYLLLYAFYSSIQTPKEEIPNPTPAQRALWYLLAINTGTLFVPFVMLAFTPRSSAAAGVLLKIMYRVGVMSFGLNLALLFAKYEP